MAVVKKPMLDNPYDTYIGYNGTVVGTTYNSVGGDRDNGATWVIKCKGKKMEDDIVVSTGMHLLQDKTATANGDVTADEGYYGLHKVTVNVPVPDGYIIPEGTLEVTANGTHDVTAYASVTVNVAAGETVEEYDGTYTLS